MYNGFDAIIRLDRCFMYLLNVASAILAHINAMFIIKCSTPSTCTVVTIYLSVLVQWHYWYKSYSELWLRSSTPIPIYINMYVFIYCLQWTNFVWLNIEISVWSLDLYIARSGILCLCHDLFMSDASFLFKFYIRPLIMIFVFLVIHPHEISVTA